MDDSDDVVDDALSSDDESDNWTVVAILLAIYSQRQPRIPSNRTFSGQDYVDDLLTCGNDVRIHTQLRMKLNTFNLLQYWLVKNASLKGSKHVSIEEKLLIFIYISSKGVSNRAAQEQFNRSAQVVSQ